MLKALTRKGQFAADAQLVIARIIEAQAAERTVGGLHTFARILTAIDLGDVDPRARTLTVVDAPAIAVLDGSTGIGQVGASRAMLLAVQKAETTGIALVVVKNSQPEADVTGIAAVAAASGCIGFCTANWGRAEFATHPDAGAWLSSQPHGWAIPHRDRIWSALRSSTETSSSTLASCHDAFRGLLALALTAGLTNSKLPSIKKRASAFGGGAEYACMAIHLPTFSATESFTRIGDELTKHASDGSAGWTSTATGTIPESLSLSAALIETLQQAGTEVRVPFPAVS